MKIELFKAVVFNIDLWKEIQSHINGKKYKDWTDGDLAAQLDYWNLIKEKIKNHEKLIITDIFINIIIQYKRIDVIKQFDKYKYKFYYSNIGCYDKPVNIIDRIIVVSTSGGNLDIIKWLYENIFECHIYCTSNSMDYAALHGHLDIIKYLHKNCIERVMFKISHEKPLNIIKLLYENRSQCCIRYAVTWAAESGHLDIVKWFHENSYEGFTTGAMDSAAFGGHLDIVKWLHENRLEGCTQEAMFKAARRRHRNILKFLYENRPECLLSVGTIRWDKELYEFLYEYQSKNCT